MKPVIAAVLLTSAALQLRADEHVIRYIDPWRFKLYTRPGDQRIPIVFRQYAGAWHSVCYYPGETGILFTGTYEDRDGSRPEGVFVYYHRSGAKASVLVYRNGELEGQSRRFDMSGRLSGTTEWVSGKRHGPERHIRPDSSVHAILQWTAGELDSAVYYHENGAIAERTIRGGNAKPVTSCHDETGKVRSCAIFANRKAVPPPVFQAFCRDELRFTKKENRREDPVLTLELHIDAEGNFHFGDLYRRRDGLNGGFAVFKGIWEAFNLIPPDLEAAGSLSVREKIKEKLERLPRAVPAYRHCVAVGSTLSVDVRFE